MPYKKWIRESWQKLERDFLSGVFKPLNESDMKAHFYSYVLETMPERYKKDENVIVTTEWRINKRDKRKVDLAIIRKNKRNGKDMPRLLVEIKKTGREKTPLDPRKIIKKVEPDLKKLRDAVSQIRCHIKNQLKL